MIVRRAMCSDGARLCGWSKLRRASNQMPTKPVTGGRGKASFSGNSRKHVPATSTARMIRLPSTWSSLRVLHKKNDNTKNASSDQYGTIIQGTNGILNSQAKFQVGTSV